jgi:cyclic beta-1,2-glucan synthetase
MKYGIITRFKESIVYITNYYRKLIKKTKQKEIIGSVNEWIVDNYYMISEQEKSIKSDYKTKEIRKIKSKRKKQLYHLIYSYLQENDFRTDMSLIFQKINKYQKDNNDYFSYYEINLIAILIKIILIDELYKLSKKLNYKLNIKDQIDKKINEINKKINNNLLNVEDYINIDKKLIQNAYYLEQLNYKLKEIGELSENIFFKLNEVLIANNISLKEVIKESHNDIAKDNFLMVNLFTSLKKITKYKIETIYKNISYTEKALLSEDADIYDKMYDSNKGDYRKKIIKLARKNKISEHEYASHIVNKANSEKKHIGWYLFKQKDNKFRTYIYISSIIILTVVLSFLLSSYFNQLVIFFIFLIPISTLVIEVLNQILSRFTKNISLFKLKFEDGLPIQYSTMVVIPTLLNDKKKVMRMFDNLEVYYLSNKTDNLYFTLLGDCSAENVKDVDKDQEIITAGLNRVNELNEKYGKKLFYFIYRNRVYNSGEQCYLGFERKRGALNHFNQLLLNKLTKEQKEQYFNCHTFDDFDVAIKYVITLDADTKLVLNTALKLIGAMAHPLNNPKLSNDKTHVISGYGIMQPRISIDVEVTNKSKYSQLFAGLGGLDIYTTACFDLYQDIFSEGSFVGKGIYDLNTFYEVLNETFPNNLILSHDLLEGNYLRCGFVNDVELFDDYPASYLNDAMRHHRWNRGDWQIIKWLTKKVKNIKDKTIKNPISALSKWKIFDNLRRSLISFSLLSILIYGFAFDQKNMLLYITFVTMIITIPILFFLMSKIFNRGKSMIFLKYYLALIRGFVAVIHKSFILFALLPYESYLYIDSMIKALYRMFISKKKLLNWITAEEIDKTLKNNLKNYIRNFKINYFMAILLIVICIVYKSNYILLAIFISLVWFSAPILMYIFSKNIKQKKIVLDEKEKLEIKDIAIKTWHYFDTFLTEEYNYLIPDNYQFNRDKKVDYKTSPTNIGFSLLSSVSAFELEIINYQQAINIIDNIIKTIEKLDKWCGHLYNWYDIYTLEKLRPHFVSTVDSGNLLAALYIVKSFIKESNNQSLIYLVDKLIDDMDFAKLYNKELDVFSIGYNASDKMLLNYHFNNFASESRITSYVAIAKGDVPFKHWFCLDKTLTKYKRYKGIASWHGTAFEYYMPLIFMKTFNHSLLDETYYFAYYAQKEFMKEINPNLPWGISESAYNELDDSENYKYKAFGVPYLKLQDSISYPIVISPYSSLMAIGIDDVEVYNNVKKLKKLDMYGEYGFYEAYDYDDKATVKNYYAHHQGMILTSLTNYLKNNVIQNYFHSNKVVEANEMLLKEKVQVKTYIDLKMEKYKKYQYSKEVKENDIREYDKIGSIPEYGVLSNGLYSILINDRGNGFSKYKNLQINRYRQIATDDYGLFLYIRNLNNDNLWCNTYAPIDTDGDKYKAIFASDCVKYIREDDGIVTNTEITVVKDHNAELRKITFINNTNVDTTLEVTSYGEVMMCRNEEDIAHRAFNNLTIHSEIDKDTSSLIFSRKSRTKENTIYYIAHRLFLNNEDNNDFEYETSRTNFLGRNNTVSNPDVIINKKSLSNVVGDCIDPIMSIRKQIKVKAKSKQTIYLLVGFGKSKEQVMEIVRTYKDKNSINKAFEMTTVFNNMRNSYANLTGVQMRLYNTMIKHIYHAFPITDERKNIITNNYQSQKDLWKFGISGDLPVILVEISKVEDSGFIKEVLQAYEFYKSRGIYVDILIINNEDSSKEHFILNYINNLMYRINNLNYFENSPGNIYIVSSSQVNDNDKILLKTVARLSLDASLPLSLEEQINKINSQLFIYENKYKSNIDSRLPLELPKDIEYYNGFGGFVNQGNEYYIQTENTPMPWSNVIANKNFGFVVTNNFGGFTYAYNSREFKLTSWSNDITEDPNSESIYINNIKVKPSCIKHGFGYSTFLVLTNEYELFIKVFASQNDTIKFYELTITNKLNNIQSLSADFVLRMVLGTSEEYTNHYIATDYNEENNCLYMKNSYNNNFKDINVFITSTEKIKAYKDKDPNIKSITVDVTLNQKETKTFSFMLGCEKQNKILTTYQNSKKINDEYNKVINYWQEKLSVIQVNTPDKSFNYAMNGWYLYQAYSSRLLSKTGFYQVGGATGFRDQLQDVMAIIYSDENHVRKQILEHAKHQFEEGDVLHWWHEELKIGSRTKFSDDYLWLVYVTYEYIKITNDYSILDEKACFVDGDKLTNSESEKGIEYHYTTEEKSLYYHLQICILRALNHFGKHELPLMGSGDWNDGMNKVGHKGKGESVFVGFFLYDILSKMATISKNYKDSQFIKMCLDRREKLKEALSNNAWDGAWYLRAYFDNGVSLGSRNNSECQIDLLCQAWSIISGIASGDKLESIIKEVDNRLVDKKYKMIKLLTPAFKNTKNNPGYIKEYGSGMRENGGQYTHAALWYVKALLKNNNIEKANEYYHMLNPINKTATIEDVLNYTTEPYVIAADVYSNENYLGRGGWTWYTGSASWAYKIGLEDILGFKKVGETLTINPKIDSKWDKFEIIYKYIDTVYKIEVNNKNHLSKGNTTIILDNSKLANNSITLRNDHKEHKVIVTIEEEI